MTQEQKAKAYDEALKKAQCWLNDPQTIQDCNYTIEDAIQNIFPSLAESEDEKNANALIRLLNNENVSSLITFEAKQQWIDWLERKKIPSVSFEPASGFDSGSAVVYHNDESEDERIRKYLIEELKATKSVGELKFIIPQPTREECIAYLEKQKECLTDNSKTSASKDKRLCKAALEGIKYLEREMGWDAIDDIDILDVKEYLEKQKERMPKRERKKPKESWLSKSKYELAHEEELLIKRQKELSEIRALKNKEQKPAEWSDYKDKVNVPYCSSEPEWSEEDEKMLASFLHKVEVCDLLTNKENVWIVERLKSLRPQPKQEWSEKDSDVLLQTAAILKANFDSDEKFEDCDYDCETLAGKLLEMRYRISPSWKPSDDKKL